MKPYIIKDMTLVLASGAVQPLEVMKSSPIRLTDYQLKHIVKQKFRTLKDRVVDVRYTKVEVGVVERNREELS
ncbi:MAG: hypothetical protein ACI36Z_03155 [Alloprevotella sp.]